MDQGTLRCFHMLVEALELAAAEPDDQVRSLPEFVDVPDEVALTLEHPCLFTERFLAEKLISDEQKARIDTLNQMFADMTEDKSLWALDQFYRSPIWGQTRILAREILVSMGIPMRKPDLSGITYIPVDLESGTS